MKKILTSKTTTISVIALSCLMLHPSISHAGKGSMKGEWENTHNQRRNVGRYHQEKEWEPPVAPTLYGAGLRLDSTSSKVLATLLVTSMLLPELVDAKRSHAKNDKGRLEKAGESIGGAVGRAAGTAAGAVVGAKGGAGRAAGGAVAGDAAARSGESIGRRAGGAAGRALDKGTAHGSGKTHTERFREIQDKSLRLERSSK